jgi:superfamily I DNA and/or RNA helicase
VTYRDLHHQVTKKKKIWPLRKVISEFEDEVFKLTPCWLASPESVSALLPMREMFDLVIFDEASQCFAERGIPALYRGKQCVVAGDSKQLRPGDFYLARWQEEDFDEPDAEVDSLLELAGRYLMKVQLNGHYRSRSWQLIQFSNKNFYDGKLQLLPHFETVLENSPAIDYIRVEGHWENNCNEEEASEVITQIQKIWNADSAKQIGIVTFNAAQQNLILDFVETQLTAYRVTPENLFVKNIENVQGDERDIIIFSVGYAPDKKGKVNLQFGSLNQDGGENRLNVAVTRAREKIIIVTSLLPTQLHVEETKNQGPKLLKDYLTYALDVSNGKELTKSKNKPLATRNPELRFLLKEAESSGISYSHEYPFADAIIFKNQKIASILLTDDSSYFQSLSSKAVHAQIPQLLELKKWPYARVYSRNFWMDKKRFYNDIQNSL